MRENTFLTKVVEKSETIVWKTVLLKKKRSGGGWGKRIDLNTLN